MKKQIIEIQNYFKQKLLSGEYEINILDSEYIIEAVIDKDFKFTIWIYPEGFKLYNSSSNPNFILIPEFSREEILQSRKNLDPQLEQLKEDIKQAQIKSLENQIESLKSK